MTPEQQEQCDKLAQWMGWKVSYDAFYVAGYRIDTRGKFIQYCDWNPFENWQHAGMLLDKLDELNINHNLLRRSIYDFEFCIQDAGWNAIIEKDADNHKAAICLAILEMIEQGEMEK